MKAFTFPLRLPVHFMVPLLVLLLLTSCNNDDDQGENTNSQTIEEIQNNMISGTWSIILYNDSGVDETSDYNDYTFTFNSNGSLLAESSTASYSGTWSVTNSSNSNDDNNSSQDEDIDFNIAFSTPDILLELTDDWDVETYSPTRIELFDVSGGDGTTDLLTFQKN
ncbi:lipocalin-like domain-containing protein [Robertkochia marina]|nr:glycoside hydrolase family 43 C-terminal domain-containing protein [Robertkochia marina]